MGSHFSRVLVAYDGSAPASVALRCANALAVHGAHLVVAAVFDAQPVAAAEVALMAYDESSGLDAAKRACEAALDAARASCLAAGVEPSVRLVQGRPVAELTTLARQIGADLIVTGTHARAGLERAVLGSTAEGLLRSAGVPVMVVREETRVLSLERPFGRLLVAIDNSGPSGAALELASSMSVSYGSSLVLCGIADTRDLNDKSLLYGYDSSALVEEMRTDADRAIVKTLEGLGRDGSSDTVYIGEGEPAAAIVGAAHESGADAIVIGTHGRRGFERFLLGSVAEHVVRLSGIPVIVVREPAAR